MLSALARKLIVCVQVMACAEPFLEQNIHPTIIIQGYRMALEDIIVWCKEKFR